MSMQIKKQNELETPEQMAALLEAAERSIASRLTQVFRAIRNQRTPEEISELLLQGQFNVALDGSQQFAIGLLAEIVNSINNVGQSIADIISAATGTVFQFNPADVQLAELISSTRLEVENYYNQNQEEASRLAVINAQDDQGFLMWLSLGLTAQQTVFVLNYRNNLLNNNRRALRAQGRNTGSDNLVRSAINNNRPLTETQIRRLVRAYANNLLQNRIALIAESEGVGAIHLAASIAYEQAFVLGILSREEINEIWNTREDGSVRMSHGFMDNQERTPGAAFISGAGALLRFPGDPSAPASETARCRCLVTRQFI